MSSSFLEVAAHGIGNLRMGGRAVPGQGRLVDAIGKLAAKFGGNLALAEPWPGVRFETDLRDRIQRQMWAGMYEPHVMACLDALLEPACVYFDVGGHIGYHAVRAANCVGAGGRVFAFEADPDIFQQLARNLAQFPWAEATHAAVWNRDGALTFERSSVAAESGWGTLSEVRDAGKGEHIQVRSVALDPWCSEKNVKRWDMMKLDAEGSELAVLRGARESLEKFHPAMIIEINGPLLKEAGIAPTEVAGFLEAANYRLFALSLGQVVRWNAAMQGGISDTLCLPLPLVDQALDRLRQRGFDVHRA